MSTLNLSDSQINELIATHSDKFLYKPCIPNKQREATGKAKKCLYEKIDPNIYDLDARIVAFRVTSSRLLHWIHALDILYYEFLGNSEDYDIKWEDDPIERKNPSDLKTITIDVSSENLAQSDKPLLFRVTVFMKTGTIQAQGNKHDIFRTRDFPMLEKIVKKMKPSDVNNDQDHHNTIAKEIIEQDSVCSPTDSNENKGGHEKTGETLFTTKCDEIKTQSESYTLNKEELINDIKNMIEEDKTTMLESLESKLKNALDNMCTQTSDYIKGRFEEWEAKYVANDTKIEKHNENLKKVLSTCTEIKQDINQKMNHSNMQPDSEHVQKLNAQIQKLQAENIELRRQNNQLQYEKSFIESNLSYEKTAHSETKNRYDSYKISANEDRTFISERLSARNLELSEMEETIKKYKQQISHKVDEILSLKSHIGSISDNLSGKFNEAKPSTATPDQPKDTKPKVILFGTSNTKNIDTDKWKSQFNCEKIYKYTLKDALKALDTIPNHSTPQVIGFHSLTNDLKTADVETCVEEMSNIANKALSLFPKANVLISLATPRADSIHYNDSAELLNAMLKRKFRNIKNILVCDNSNMSYKGTPKSKLLDRDGYHLNEEGVTILASNIRQSIEKLCGLEPHHTQPAKDTTSSGNNTPRTNQRDRRYSNRGRSNNQGNRRHKQPNYVDPYYSWGNSYQYY